MIAVPRILSQANVERIGRELRAERNRLARIGRLHEEQLPTPTPRRRDGYPDNRGTEP